MAARLAAPAARRPLAHRPQASAQIRGPAVVARSRQPCGSRRSIHGRADASQGSSELVRQRKTSDRSPRRTCRIVLRLHPVRRTIALIPSPLLASLRDRGIRLLASQVAVVLDPLGSSEQGGVDHGRADHAADRGHHATHHVQESGTGVLHEVPAVGDLQRLRANPGHRLAVAATTITRDDRDLGVRRQPGIQRGGCSIRQQIDDPATLQIADQRAVALPALPRPVVDADDRWRIVGPSGATAQRAKQRVAADRHQQPGRKLGTRTTTERQAEMVRQPVEPGRAPCEACRDPIVEALGEDPCSASRHHAAEAPDDDSDTQHAGRSREDPAVFACSGCGPGTIGHRRMGRSHGSPTSGQRR